MESKRIEKVSLIWDCIASYYRVLFQSYVSLSHKNRIVLPVLAALAFTDLPKIKVRISIDVSLMVENGQIACVIHRLSIRGSGTGTFKNETGRYL